MEQQNILATGSIGKLLFRLALPSITAQIINVLYNMVDRMFIGHISDIGSMALTGVGITFPIITLISAFSGLIGMGGAPLAAIEMGKQNMPKAEKILGNCVTSLVVTSIFLMAFILYFQNTLLTFFGASENTIQYASDYLTIYVCGTLFVQISLGLNTFITSQGFAKISMSTVMIGAILNMILDPILIFGFHMGVKGAALATILSQCVSAVWVIHFLLGNRTKLRIKKQYLKIEQKLLFSILALGISPFIMQSTESLLTICLNTSLQKYGGDLAVGSMTILTSIMQFSMLPLLGLTQGAQPIVSFNYGAKQKQRVKKTIFLLLRCCFCYSFILWLIIMLFPHLFVKIFTNSSELISFSCWALRIFMGVSCLMGIQIGCQQSFLALGQAKVSMFLALLRKIILLIPLIYILPLFFENKVFSIFLAEPVADSISITTTSILFYIQFRKILSSLPDNAENSKTA